MQNSQIIQLLKLHAKLLELHGYDNFKIRAYTKAADAIYDLNEEVVNYSENQLSSIQGIGKTLAKVITQIINEETFYEHEQLILSTPHGVVEMLSLKGLGPKKVRTLWKEGDIISVEELATAVNDSRVEKLPGFAKKSQENIKQLLEFYHQNRAYYLYYEVEIAEEIICRYLSQLPSVQKISPTADFIRKSPTLDKLELLILTIDPQQTINDIVNSTILTKLNDDDWSFADQQLRVIVHFANSDQDYRAKEFLLSCSDIHRIWVEKKGYQLPLSAEEFYQSVGLQFIIPEAREDIYKEEDFLKFPSPDFIVEEKHLKGALHNHSFYSDGTHSLERMAEECVEMGLEYFGIADHSQTAVYANGLKPERVINQWKEIDELNEKFKNLGFKILKGIESDILTNGSLDYDEEILKGFDYVVASVHSKLKMTEEEATNRLIKAIENPYTTILGHPTGRLLIRREGYPLDYDKIFDACVSNKVVLELNANPHRLDLDWKLLRKAVDKGLLISINPDAHHFRELHLMRFGVNMARKAALEPKHIINTYPLEQLSKVFKKQF